MSHTPPPLTIGPLTIDPPLLLAPMAGFTDHAFRQLLRQLGGVGLLVTEMVSARGFLFGNARRREMPERLWGAADEPRPLAVQIWDNDPAALAEVGRRLVVEFRASVVDINFGCPSPDVSQKAQSGAHLLRHPDRVGAIVARVAAACAPAPVTAKIRLGCTRDTINAIDVAQAVEGAGGAALTIHGRTAADMYRGTADWDRIAEVKPHLRRIPLVGNGDLRTPQDVVDAFRRYPIDGAMIGRAALGRPWLFRRAAAALCGAPVPPEPTPAEQRDVLLEHFRLVVAQYGPGGGAVRMRRFAACYAQGLPGARSFRARIARVATPEEFHEAVVSCFPGAAEERDA